jgi:hypothetical protein
VQRLVPDGWPGLAGIVVLVAALFALHGRPSNGRPVDGAGDAVGGYLAEFAYAAIDAPSEAIAITDAATAYAAVADAYDAIGEEELAVRHGAVVALFDNAAAARAAADAVEADGLTVVVDRLVVVVGLDTQDETALHEVVEAVSDARLALVEGDRGGEGSIVVDAACEAPSDAAASEIATALGDYGAAPSYAFIRPPWLGPPLTADEALARSTYRRWMAAYTASFADDPFIASWAARFEGASSQAEARRLMDELTSHMLDQRPVLDGEIHREVIDVIANHMASGDPDAYTQAGRRLGELMGAMPSSAGATDDEPSWYDTRHGGSIGSVRAVRSTVQVGWASFTTFPLGALGLLSYLDAHGCDEVRIGLSDFDDVRGD